MGLSFSFTSGKNPVCRSVVLSLDYESGVLVYVCWITTVWTITPRVLDTCLCWLLPTTCTIEILDIEFLPCVLKSNGLIFFFLVIIQSLRLWCWYTKLFPLKHVNSSCYQRWCYCFGFQWGIGLFQNLRKGRLHIPLAMDKTADQKSVGVELIGKEPWYNH